MENRRHTMVTYQAEELVAVHLLDDAVHARERVHLAYGPGADFIQRVCDEPQFHDWAAATESAWYRALGETLGAYERITHSEPVADIVELDWGNFIGYLNTANAVRFAMRVCAWREQGRGGPRLADDIADYVAELAHLCLRQPGDANVTDYAAHHHYS